MYEYIELGSAPVEEDCAQVSSAEDYMEAMVEECRRYKALLESIFFDMPETVRLIVKRFPHDFGSYYEVVARYPIHDETAADYAWSMEDRLPLTWDD
jgi:hypothetical protein